MTFLTHPLLHPMEGWRFSGSLQVAARFAYPPLPLLINYSQSLTLSTRLIGRLFSSYVQKVLL